MGLSIENLNIDIKIEDKYYPVVEGISLRVDYGEMVGLVGESGCGKTISASSILGLLPEDAYVRGGSIYFNDQNILTKKNIQEIRGRQISMIFQDPMTSLNPLIRVGRQVSECLKINKKEAKIKSIEILKRVGLSEAEKIYNMYPHQLSGGMKQRVMIAIALINKPDLLIADEPTTALDVTTEASILNLIKGINKETNTSVLFISHDLNLVKAYCDRVYIMYNGKIVESGLSKDVFNSPKHPYTRGLINSIPDISKKGSPLYSIKGLVEPLTQRHHEGCPFYGRCNEAMTICEKEVIKETGISHKVFCHLYKGESSDE